jgi:hypothetical protein
MSVQVWRCYLCGALCTNIDPLLKDCLCEVDWMNMVDRGHCDRCQIYIWDLVSCIGPDGELLGRICEDCAKEYLASGLDDL